MERYVDAVYNEASLRIVIDKLNDSRSLLEKTQRMEELGEKGYPDVAQIEAQVAEDEYSVEHLRTAADKAMVALRLAMRAPIDSKMTLRALELTADSMLPGEVGIGADSSGAGGSGLMAKRLFEAASNLATAQLDYNIVC